MRAKRHQSESGKLKILQTKWNANYCDAKNEAKQGRHKSQFDPTKEKPCQIGQERNGASMPILNVMAKRPQNQLCEFETLDAQRNAHDSQAAQEAGKRPKSGQNEAPQQEP